MTGALLLAVGAGLVGAVAAAADGWDPSERQLLLCLGCGAFASSLGLMLL